MQCLRLLSDRKHEVTVNQAKRCDFDNGVGLRGRFSSPQLFEKVAELLGTRR
jgi:hypothetical protein